MNTCTSEAVTMHMPLINEIAPDFTAETTQGTIRFHEWIGDSWAVLFSHPKDFTPVCTTELGTMAALHPEFAKRNTKIIALSVDPVSEHGRWVPDIEETQGCRVNYPIIGDPRLEAIRRQQGAQRRQGRSSIAQVEHLLLAQLWHVDVGVVVPGDGILHPQRDLVHSRVGGEGEVEILA